MKLTIALLLTSASLAIAQSNALPSTDSLLELKAGVLAAHQITMGTALAYAPNLQSSIGYDLFALYPMTEHTFAGLRMLAIGNRKVFASASVGLSYTFVIAKQTLTAFTIGGVVTDVSGAVGGVVGAGVDYNIWTHNEWAAHLFLAYDKWTIYDNADIYHIGPCVTYKF